MNIPKYLKLELANYLNTLKIKDQYFPDDIEIDNVLKNKDYSDRFNHSIFNTMYRDHPDRTVEEQAHYCIKPIFNIDSYLKTQDKDTLIFTYGRYEYYYEIWEDYGFSFGYKKLLKYG